MTGQTGYTAQLVVRHGGRVIHAEPLVLTWMDGGQEALILSDRVAKVNAERGAEAHRERLWIETGTR